MSKSRTSIIKTGDVTISQSHRTKTREAARSQIRTSRIKIGGVTRS